MDTATKTRCEVVDQIIEWTDKDGVLQIEQGDLVLEGGQFEKVTRLYWDRELDRHVGVSYDGSDDTVHWKRPDELVAVRRYTETTEA